MGSYDKIMETIGSFLRKGALTNDEVRDIAKKSLIISIEKKIDSLVTKSMIEDTVREHLHKRICASIGYSKEQEIIQEAMKAVQRDIKSRLHVEVSLKEVLKP